MSDHERTSTIPAAAPADGADVVEFPRTRERERRLLRPWRRRNRPKRFRIRKLRVLLLLFGLGILAVVSALFGMFMAVASDLPPLEEPAHQPSVIVDARGKPIGTLTGNERRIYLSAASTRTAASTCAASRARRSRTSRPGRPSRAPPRSRSSS
jgi:penicillin-binding protein 1A